MNKQRSVVRMLGAWSACWSLGIGLVACGSAPSSGEGVAAAEATASAPRDGAISTLPPALLPSEVAPPKPDCVYPDSYQDAAPTWICRPAIEGVHITALGVFDPSMAPSSPVSARDQATWNARAELAQHLLAHVTGLVQQYMEATRATDVELQRKLRESLSTQCAADKLTQVRIAQTADSPKGVFYALGGLPPQAVRANTLRVLRASMEVDRTLWKRVKTRKTLESLAVAIAAGDSM